MSREEFLERLNEALDERRAPEDDAWLKARADEDPQLRSLLDGHRTLLDGLRQRPENSWQPAAGLAERVLADLQSQPKPGEQESPPLRASQVLAWAAALAAAILLGLIPLFRERPEPGGVAKRPAPEAPAPEDIARNETPAPAPESPDAPEAPTDEPPIPVLVQQAGSHYLDLAQETRNSFAEVALLLPGVNNNPNHAPRKPLVDQVGDGLKPITSSVGGAFNFLIESIPVEDGPTS